jgi:hypothetical protein
LPKTIEEADDPLRLLKRLDEPVEKDPVKAAVAELYAIPVMLVEGVHRPLLLCRTSRISG